MGQGLLDEVREFASVEKHVGAPLGYSMRKLCLEDADNLLKQANARSRRVRGRRQVRQC